MDVEVAERFERIEAILAVMAQSFFRLQDILGSVVETINRYADASDARMKRMEDNLDLLIRAIAAEHTNGQGKLL